MTHVADVTPPSQLFPEQLDAVVIGAGQAGLATGYWLKRYGLRFVLLEADLAVGGSWTSYYDSLKLFSPARYSALPGLAFPGDPEHYPTRDEVVAYLRTYREHFSLPVVMEAEVVRVEQKQASFRTVLRDGRSFHSPAVIAATGSFRSPHLPELPGQARFRGQVLHARNYRQPAPFADQRVLVVGAGNSAVQIAVELARHARVTLATRGPVRFAPQRLLGQDLHFWLRVTGLDNASWLSDQSTPVLDGGRYRQALKADSPARRRMFEHFTEDGVVWPGGEREGVDAVIFATGYRPRFPYLGKMGTLDKSGKPVQRRGVSPDPGLYFVGLSGQRNVASATLRGVGSDGAYIVKHLRRHLKGAPSRGTP